MPEIRSLSTPEDVRLGYPVMAQLRPHLSADDFVEQALRQIAEQQYHLTAVVDGDRVTAVAGYRLAECLADGRYLYVDDLVADGERRSQGHGGMLFDWLVHEAQRKGCRVLTLDSGVHRFAAHRFYLTKRMEIRAHHFVLALDNG